MEDVGLTQKSQLTFTRRELRIEGGRCLYLYEFDTAPEGTDAEGEPASERGELEPEAGG